LPFALAGPHRAGVDRAEGQGGRPATAAVVIAAIGLMLRTGVYVEQAVSKLA
jgi:hypothetical protein